MVDLLVVLFKGCGEPCNDVLKQLNEPSMRKYLKEAFSIDKIKELDAESDDLAGQIMLSTEEYDLPILATLKNGSSKKVCTFRLDPVGVDRCVDLKDAKK